LKTSTLIYSRTGLLVSTASTICAGFIDDSGKVQIEKNVWIISSVCMQKLVVLAHINSKNTADSLKEFLPAAKPMLNYYKALRLDPQILSKPPNDPGSTTSHS